MQKRAKKLNIRDYPTKTNFSLEAHIKNLVNRESEAMVKIEIPQAPKYERPKVYKNNVSWWNFFRQIRP